MPIILFGIIMILGDDFMIDLSIPSDTLGLFNFKQFVKKDGKNTFKYIFFDNYDYIINLHDKGKLRDVSFDNVQKTILCSSIHLDYGLFVVARNTLASLFNNRKYRKQKLLEKKKGIFYHKKAINLNIFTKIQL